MVLEGMEDAPYFYSRPCGRGDVAGGRCFEIRALISTHAPAGGATDCVYRARWRGQKISTHAPAGGATLDVDVGVVLFNISTHAPAGGATVNATFYPKQVAISTHAPAGGATAGL